MPGPFTSFDEIFSFYKQSPFYQNQNFADVLDGIASRSASVPNGTAIFFSKNRALANQFQSRNPGSYQLINTEAGEWASSQSDGLRQLGAISDAERIALQDVASAKMASEASRL